VTKSLTLLLISLVVGLADCPGQDFVLEQQPVDHFKKTIRPLLNRYCIDCHAHEGKESEFLWPETELDATKLRNSFASVFQRMDDRSMPPAKSAQPSERERRLIADWIKTNFDLKSSDFDRLSEYVVEIFEDSKGKLWFGTVSDGAACFDGNSLTWFSKQNGLAGNTVVSIAEDQQGHIWFGTEHGVSKFDGQAFSHYSDAEGLPGTRCYILIDRKGTVWVGTERGVFRFKESRFTQFEIPTPETVDGSFKVGFGKVWCLIEDRAGNIWIGRDGLGACRFDGTAFTHFTKKDGLCSDNVSSIVEDRKGNIWFGCLSSDQPTYVDQGGLNRFDGNSFTKFPETKGLFETDIYTIYETKAGDIWIGATGVGAYRFSDNKFTLFAKTDRPYWTRYFGVQSMRESHDGTLWFGFSGGLFRFRDDSFCNVGREGPWSLESPQDKTAAEQADPPILESPDGWSAEELRFPLSFAPSIEFQGREDIRFAPGWSNPNSSEFWTYKFAWQIDEDPKLTELRIAELMETYFDGLSRAVAQGGGQDISDLQKPVAVFIQDGETFKGRLRIYDSFSTKSWISLNARLKSFERGGKHIVVFELSPKPFDHAVWESLEKIRAR
jgi:Two component regulator propeller